LTEKIVRKKLVKDNVIELLAKISGWMLFTYIIAKIIDTIYWAAVTAPSKGFTLMQFYSANPGSAYGLWILVLEILICGVLPAIILITERGRKNQTTLWLAVFLAALGVCLNRWVMVLQVLAVPVLPFESWATYFPSWQEIATTILPVAYGVILISLSYRYLPVFPQEEELNPMELPIVNVAAPQRGKPGAAPEAELKPVKA
jgi:molybdopterin-containing oxidoreductase family membrane subunit